jgi:hypothetical protein
MIRLAWNLWSAEEVNAINIARMLDTCGDFMLGLGLTAMEVRGR